MEFCHYAKWKLVDSNEPFGTEVGCYKPTMNNNHNTNNKSFSSTFETLMQKTYHHALYGYS